MVDILYGGIEAGGTKFVCCVADGKGGIKSEISIKTGDPEDTLRDVVNFFKQYPEIKSIGVGSFGPLCLDPNSDKFGFITTTTKVEWQNTNIRGYIEAGLKVPVVIESDVNCAGFGEIVMKPTKQLDNFVYITIGTGIGGSIFINGQPYHGIEHLEMGHVKFPHESFESDFEGICSYHKDCFEGIASGPAMERRWGQKAEELTNQHAWDLEAQYIARAVANLALIVRPRLFILGGGVMKHDGLIEPIRSYVESYINKYIKLSELSTYIIHSSGTNNGVIGAIKLATTIDSF